jgi:putative hemolysin
MTRHAFPFAVRLAATVAEVAAAQALRYRVFVEEQGAEAGAACDAARREWDRHDAACEHLLLIDALRGDRVVGATRLMDGARPGEFATEAEFDIAALRASGRRLMEIGRTCLDPAVRGGSGMHALWQAIGRIATERDIGVLFGLASLPGLDAAALAGPLALLHAEHLAPPALRPRSREPVPMAGRYDRVAATLALPPLVKGYLRLGGQVGEGAFADRAFGCTDVCMVLDTARPGPAAARLRPLP